MEREEKMMPLPIKNELLPSRSARVWLQIEVIQGYSGKRM
jgi:hypothetical protein